jgi:hypothetical protein
MRKANFLIVVCLLLECKYAQAFVGFDSSSVKFVLGKAKASDIGVPAANFSIQTLTIKDVKGLSPGIVDKINSQLSAKVKTTSREIKICGSYAQGHPWGYDVKFEKILVSEEYISTIFEKSTVCAGSPNIEKVALVFLKSDGSLIPAVKLVKRFVSPSANIAQNRTSNKERVVLDEETVEEMVEDSEAEGISRNERCDFFLKTTSYSAWVDTNKLVLFPGFTQTNSYCLREYIIQSYK